MKMRQVLLLILVALLAAGCGAVNRSIQIGDGEQVDGDVRNVNGAIRIGSNCSISGDVRNVNGSIQIGAGTRAGQVRNTNGSIELAENVDTGGLHSTNGRIRVGKGSTVEGDIANTNGAIELGEEVSVNGDVETTNGPVRMAAGSQVSGTVSSLNGPMVLAAARAGGIASANGGIELLDGTVIEGEIHVRDKRGSVSSKIPRVILGRDVVVEGPVRIERDVQLYVHESARTGEISGADPIRFSGERP